MTLPVPSSRRPDGTKRELREHDWRERSDSGQDVLDREQADRALERGDSPLTHLSVEPLDVCRECGYMAREVEPGRWICPCEPWSAAA